MGKLRDWWNCRKRASQSQGGGVSSSASSSGYGDSTAASLFSPVNLLSPLNPLSPLSPLNPAMDNPAHHRVPPEVKDAVGRNGTGIV